MVYGDSLTPAAGLCQAESHEPSARAKDRKDKGDPGILRESGTGGRAGESAPDRESPGPKGRDSATAFGHEQQEREDQPVGQPRDESHECRGENERNALRRRGDEYLPERAEPRDDAEHEAEYGPGDGPEDHRDEDGADPTTKHASEASGGRGRVE